MTQTPELQYEKRGRYVSHIGLRMVQVGQLDIAVVLGSLGKNTTQFLAVTYPKLVPRDVSVGGVDVRIGNHAWGGEGAGGGWYGAQL